MKARKSTGPSTMPCGTPDSTGTQPDPSPTTTTLCVRPSRKDFIHAWVFPLIPWFQSLVINRWCGTLSNAFEKSRTIMSTCAFSSRCSWSSWVRPINCVSQLHCFLKPCWQSAKIPCSSKCFIIWDTTTCSMSFEQMHVSETGR